MGGSPARRTRGGSTGDELIAHATRDQKRSENRSGGEPRTGLSRRFGLPKRPRRSRDIRFVERVPKTARCPVGFGPQLEDRMAAIRIRIGFAVAALAAASWAVTGIAQSPTPFGIPTADKPIPGADIKAVRGSRAQGWLDQGRSEVLARHGMVATSDPLAAEAGLEILRKGGNAIDAAVATGAVLDVTSQNDTGIGGDLFAIVWSAKDKKLYALNSGGWAPAGWTPEFFTEKLGVKRVPNSGVNSASVPGAISGYDALLKRFGTVTFNEAFERAARLADEGWGLAERHYSDLRGAVNGLKADPDSRKTFLINDQAPPLYSIIRNPGLSKALRIIQKKGRDGFYKGEI